ncbi:hypothetical protein, partial [Acidaminococcus fermentans]|uniref:hypothetical protein n=1 Tax=Acidaminococcus fermentans TaxID=905 RepID=UPI003077F377
MEKGVLHGQPFAFCQLSTAMGNQILQIYHPNVDRAVAHATALLSRNHIIALFIVQQDHIRQVQID